MRNLFTFEMVTVDGYHAGPDGEIDWHNADAEFKEFSVAQLAEIGTLVFGRVTYEVMAAWWPAPEGKESHPVIAERMNSLEKVVVSRTLERADWRNTRVVRDVAAIAALKREPGADIAVFGSSGLSAALLDRGLIDELRIMTAPVVLGAGRPYLGSAGRTALELVGSRSFASGNVLSRYRPA